MNLLKSLLESRIVGLIYKEAMHTLRDKHLLFLLIFPPTLQLLILGAALDVGLRNVPMGLVDNCQSSTSRRLISALSDNDIFRFNSAFLSEQELTKSIKKTDVKIGVLIPSDFERDLARDHVAHVKIIIDGVDAYTANVARSYLMQIFQHFEVNAEPHRQLIKPTITTFFNPGLVSSWYFVPGVIGAMLTLTSTLVSSASLLREKELGTLEQLLMTPYSVGEILFAKVLPVFLLLVCDVFLALGMALFVFKLPFRGDIFLFLFASALYICVGIGLGILMATVCKTERQAHLVSFFVNIPVMQLSGAVVPFETMPLLLRQIATIDPLRDYTIIARSLFLKGTGVSGLTPHLLMLAAAAMVLFSFSLLRFRKQLD